MPAPRPRAARAAVLVALPLLIAAAPPLTAPATGAPWATGHAASPRPATASCTTPDIPLGFALLHDIATALRDHPATVAVHLDDPASGTTCELRADRAFDSASVIKVTVLGALLMAAQEEGRRLTSEEAALARAMITRSDNESTSTLWRRLGVERIEAFRKTAGMTRTVPGARGAWGLTQTTARDQNALLSLLTTPGSVLTDASREYALGLLADVVPSQRWGTPAGAPSAATVRLKNGWLPRRSDGWRVHSAGTFAVGERRYHLTVLTEDNRDMDGGVAAIEAVSRALHARLAPAAGG
ncbi:serine hydrolase [Streptomyces sp. NPDC058953]|uniref:serine hydrolase n=1 Tax=Streptomyces sp. NPDC058953 TaxID=3346676 RepID=UPI0036C215C0